MANDKRFIVKNGLRADNVEFTDSQDGSNQITLNMLNTDTLNFEGDAGSLFSISDDLTGTVFSVGDISGIPIIEVNGDNHNVTFNEFDGKVMIGGTDSGGTDSDVLNVTGNVRATGATITGTTTTGGLFSNGSIGNTQSAKGVYAGLSNGGDAQIALVGDNTDVTPQIDFSHDVNIDFDARIILDTNGNRLKIASHGNESMAHFNADGAVELYHNDSKKFETTSTGINALGNINLEPNSGSFRDIGFGTTDNTTLVLSGGGSSGVTAGNIELVRQGNVNIDGLNINLRSPTASSTYAVINDSGASITGDLVVSDNIQMEGSTYTDFSDWWGSGDNSAFFTPYGYLGSNGAFAVSLFSNGYRNNGGTFTSMGINSNSTASGIELYPTGEIKFRTGTPSGTSVPERMSLTDDTLAITTDFRLTSTDAGATENPTLDLYRNSASPADQDIIGHITYSGENSASEKIVYGEIQSKIRDVTDATEDGAIETFVRTAGSLDLYTVHQDGQSQFYKDVAIISSDAGATENPTLDLFRNSSTPADDDILGNITFTGKDDNGDTLTYAQIQSKIFFPTDTNERGGLQFDVMQNGSLVTYLDMIGNSIALNRSTTINNGDLTVTSTDDGATENPTLDLYRNSASPANGDDIGHITFSGENSASEKIVYAEINADMQTVTDGSEYGRFFISVMDNGSASNRIFIQGNGPTKFLNRPVEIGSSSSLRFQGSTDDGNETTLTVTDPTADRTITFPDASGTVALTSDISGGGGGLDSADVLTVVGTGSLTGVSGGFAVNGLLSATTKSFDIEHPTEEGKRLRYGSLEGPENGVYVRGRLKDNNTIQLPDHWTGLVDVDTITVNLTPIGSQQSLFVEDIADNQILIGGCRKHVDAWDINCFYTVYGERKDVDQLIVEYDA